MSSTPNDNKLENDDNVLSINNNTNVINDSDSSKSLEPDRISLNNTSTIQNKPEDDERSATASKWIKFRSSPNFLSFTVALAVFVDLLCYGIIMPLTPFIVERLGLESTANGGLVACYAVGLLIASPVAGIISDRIANRRIPMVAGLVALMLATVMFMEAMNHFWLLLISRFCAGVAGGTMMTLGFALLSDTYPANQLGTEMGKVMIGQSLGLMAGPPLGGVLQDNLGEKAPYVFCLILIGIDLVARLLIIEPRGAKVKALRKFQEQQRAQQQVQQQATGKVDFGKNDLDSNKGIAPAVGQIESNLKTIKELLSNKRLLTALVISFVNAFLIAAFEPVLPLYLEKRFSLSKTQIGVVFLAISLPTFVSPVAGWLSDKHGAKIMSGVAIALCAVLAVVTGIPGLPLWAIVLCLVGIGATCAIYITPVLAEISAVVRVTGDGDGFARAFALFNICFSLGMVVGPLLGSLIYQETSMIWTCVLIGAITILIVPMVFMYTAGKSQKLEDQAQYEKDMRLQDGMLKEIKQQQKTMEESKGEDRSVVDSVDKVV